MKPLRALAILTGLLLGACDDHPDYPDYRYKITIETETPSGPRSYSAVRQVDAGGDPLSFSMPNAPRIDRRISGEGVILDLPGGGTVFAIMATDYSEFPEDFALPSDTSKAGAARLWTMVAAKGAYELPRVLGNGASPWPRLVRFDRAGDPRSVIEVDPEQLPGGSRVRRITVEITDEPITWKMKDKLPWIGKYSQVNFAGNSSTFSSALDHNLGASNFTKGERK